MDLTTCTAAFSTIAVIFLTMFITKIIARRIVGPMGKTRSLQPPPVVSGASLLAALPTLLTKGLQAVIHDMHTELGSVFTVSLFGLKKVTFLVGSDVTSHFFQGSQSEIGQGNTYNITVPIFGPGVMYDVDFATRSKQILFLAEAIQPTKLRGHVDSIVREVQEYFAKWEEDGIVDLKHELGHIFMLIASRCLLGEEIREKMFEQVSVLLRALSENSFHMISLFFPYLPIPLHHRRDKARAKLGEIFREIVRSRRGSGRVENDMIQNFLDSKYRDGRSMAESEIVGLLITIIFAGQFTSSSTSTWTGACLHTHEKYLTAATEEQKQIIGRNGQHVDYSTLSEMGTLHCCIKEALRMNSPVPMLIRHANKSFTVQTRQGNRYEIQKGHVLASSVVAGSKLPYTFKDPHVYDPYRFGPGREEDKVGGKFSYTAFGGGRHACLGEDFAYMQIKVVWSHLLRNFELKMLSPFPAKEQDKLISGPRGKVMFSYKRRLLVSTAH